MLLGMKRFSLLSMLMQHCSGRPASIGDSVSLERVLLTGSPGLIGTSLVRSLMQNRISTITLHRRPSAQRTEASELWDPYAAAPVSRPEGLEGITAAVHLSGANLAGRRWTTTY